PSWSFPPCPRCKVRCIRSHDIQLREPGRFLGHAWWAEWLWLGDVPILAQPCSSVGMMTTSDSRAIGQRSRSGCGPSIGTRVASA
ncbi:unnamed protein product, partial [Ectocarpus sp. 6 AP-2014]